MPKEKWIIKLRTYNLNSCFLYKKLKLVERLYRSAKNNSNLFSLKSGSFITALITF